MKHSYIDFLFGVFASATALTLGYPFDVIKKRKQAQNLLLHHKILDKKLSAFEIYKVIIEKEGFFQGLFKGITLNIVKTPTAAGITWTIKNHLNRRIDKNYDL